MNSESVFDLYSEEYEQWFETHKLAYLSELEALRKAFPSVWKDGLEIVVGTGRFAQPLDVVLLAFTLCFVKEPEKVLKEAQRVLKPTGRIILGIIDRNSQLGKIYQKRKDDSKFYKIATFYSAEQVIYRLNELGFKNINTLQTLTALPEELQEIEPPREGYGKGSFVALIWI